MSEQERREQHMDAEDAKRLSEAIDTAAGPGPRIDQDAPAPMPLFDENDRATREVQSAIDPEEFAELAGRTGDELDGIRPMSGSDKLGVAGRAAKVHPPYEDIGGDRGES